MSDDPVVQLARALDTEPGHVRDPMTDDVLLVLELDAWEEAAYRGVLP